MTSRKRNKGRDRKAKKAALEVERIDFRRGIVRNRWKSWSRGDINGQLIQCNHGVDLVIPDDVNHPVTSFMDALFMYDANDSNILSIPMEKYLRETFATHREVWDNERYREMAVNIFIAIGTNLLLSNERGDSFLAQAIVISCLENYDGSSDSTSLLYNRVVGRKMNDLFGSTYAKRDALKFFRKRTSCSCLKDMHLETRKTLPKTGVCNHCEEEKDRALLMVCSRCRIAQYCSRECQVANWSRHKVYCDECIVLVEQQGAKNN